MCGLCGNFDGNVNNDLMSSNNQLEVDSSHFGNSWKVAPSCADVTKVSSGLKREDYHMRAFTDFDLEQITKSMHGSEKCRHARVGTRTVQSQHCQVGNSGAVLSRHHQFPV